VEFADYRPYEVGDDLRYVDWNAFARLNRLYLKVFVDEEDLCVHLILDGSASMDFGSPNKFQYAVRLAAALAFVGFTNLERVGVAVFRDRVSEGGCRPVAATSSCRWPSSSAASFRPGRPASTTRSPSTPCGPRTRVAIVISDFLDPEGTRAGSGP
jgi:hypothetical protein